MKKIAYFLILVFLLVQAFRFGSDYWTNKELEKVTDNWPTLEQNLANLSEKMAATYNNASAVELEKLYNALEIQGQEEVIDAYLLSEKNRSSNLIGAPPDSLSQLLNNNSNILNRAAGLLLNSEKPVLYYDPELRAEDEVPSIIWLEKLNQLFLVKALLAQQSGNTAAAWENLQAACNLVDAAFANPTLAGQMLAVASASDILLVMRKLGSPVAEELANWPDHDFEEMFLLALTFEAKYFLTVGNSEEILPLITLNNRWSDKFGLEPLDASLWTRIIGTIAEQPYLRLLAINRLSGMRQQIDMFASEGLCVKKLRDEYTTDKPHIPEWLMQNELLRKSLFGGPDGMMDLSMYWRKLHRIFIYKAGTNSVLALKIDKEQSGGVLPDTHPDFPKSCDALQWSYSALPGEGFKIEFDGGDESTALESIPPEHLLYNEISIN